MGDNWNNFKDKIVRLQGNLSQFQVDFLDRNSFKDFVDNRWSSEISGFPEICITGYVSETIRDKIQYLMHRKPNVRLISQELPSKLTKRDRRNLEVLEKLSKAGVKIKLNHRVHARLLIAYNPSPIVQGLAIIGSFDFNSECIGKERYDAGVITRHPDIVKSVVELFEQIWNEPASKSLDDNTKKV